MSNITQSHLNKARDDKFLLSFNVPTALKKINDKFTRDNTHVNVDSIQFSVYGTMVPEIEVPATEIRYGGSTLYQSSHTKNSYPPVTVNFTVDSRFNNYWMIYSWLNLLHDEKTGLFDAHDLIPAKGLPNSSAHFDEYQTNIIITAFDEYNKEVISFTYTKAFPTSISDLKFIYREGKEIDCSFTFVYSQLYVKLLDI